MTVIAPPTTDADRAGGCPTCGRPPARATHRRDGKLAVHVVMATCQGGHIWTTRFPSPTPEPPREH